MATIKSHAPDAERTAGSLHRDGSAASWWVYYLSDEGKTVYITAIPLPKKNAMGHCRAAQRYYRGRHVIQITETPPNSEVRHGSEPLPAPTGSGAD